MKLFAIVQIWIFLNTFLTIKFGAKRYSIKSIVIGISVYNIFYFLDYTFLRFLKPIKKNVEKHIIRRAWIKIII